MELLSILALATAVYFVIQFVRLLLADADLSLLWAARFGKKVAFLAGEVVWITGASSGIGEHLAYELAKNGCKLVLSARRKEKLDEVKAKCLELSGVSEADVLVLPMDMVAWDKHQALTEQVLEHFGRIDVLVNNAGRSQRALAVNTSVEVDRELLEVNTLSVFSLTKSVLPSMLKKKKGHVAVTSSIAGKIGAPFSATYSATKFAIQGWFDALRVEVAEHNVTVTTICPGPVHSNIQKEAATGIAGQKYKDVANTDVEERRVSTDRCSYLIAVTLANKLEEVWISLQPVLLFTYLNQYMPNLTRSVAKKLGVKAINKLREGQEREFSGQKKDN